MKKNYEVPNAEFSMFDVDGVIMTGGLSGKLPPYEPVDWNEFEVQVVKQGVANAAVNYASYEW